MAAEGPPTRGMELSEATRNQVIGMRKHKSTFVEIGDELHINADTARFAWNRYKDTNSVANASRSGRPTILTDRDRRQLLRYVTSSREQRREPLAEIALNLNLSVSNDTLRIEIEKFGLGHRIERKKP